jgi:autoinducer-2 kinase
VSQQEWAHRAPPGVPCGQDFDVHANWQAIAACVRAALRAAGADGADVAAVSTTSMREGIVLYDFLYDAVGSDIWACPNVDSRASVEAAELISMGAAQRIYAEVGDWVSSTPPARLRWLARHRPHILREARSLSMLSDWITYRLARALATEPSCGSNSGMFSLVDRSWSESIAPNCALPVSVLPPVVDPGTIVGSVTAEAQRRPDCGQVRRWSQAVRTPSSGCSAPGCVQASSPCRPGRSGRTQC